MPLGSNDPGGFLHSFSFNVLTPRLGTDTLLMSTQTKGDTMTDDKYLLHLLRDHGLPGSFSADGTEIQTVDEWTEQGVLHSTPIRITATIEAVRNFLGY